MSTGTLAWLEQFGSEAADHETGIATDADGVYVAGYTHGTLPEQTNLARATWWQPSSTPRGIWSGPQQFGSAGYDYAHNITTHSGNIYVVGYTLGTFPGETSEGGTDAFVVKLDSAGNILWTTQFGPQSADSAYDVAVDANGVYVVGRTSGSLHGETSLGDGDAFVVKLNLEGDILWTRQFGSEANDIAFAITVEGRWYLRDG